MSTDERLEVPVDMGAGMPIVILHGYGMRPFIYRPMAGILATRARVLIPDLFALHGRWSYERVLAAFAATLDDLEIERVTMIGHSFGGGIELGFASHHPERVVGLVFSDTLAVSAELGLADKALRHPLRLRYLATAPAAAAFLSEWLTHPRQMCEAAWWGFRSQRTGPIDDIAKERIPAHVLWANRDSILPRSEGEEFAKRLNATFTVAESPDGHPVDHDWMFQSPHLFVAHLLNLGLSALGS